MNNKDRGEEALKKLDRALKSRDRAEKTRPLVVVFAAVAVIVLVVGGIYLLTTHEGDSDDDVVADSEATHETLSLSRKTALPKTVTCDYPDADAAARDVPKPPTKDIPATGMAHVTLDTTRGPIGLDLDRAASPCTVNAFTHLAKEKFFDDTVCHRLTGPGGLNVLQCGDPKGNGTGGPGFSFANEYPTDETGNQEREIPVTYPEGTIAMANSGLDTNGSQFFLNYADSMLQPKYTYFGKVTEEGMKSLKQIAEKGTDDGSQDGAPAEEVRIKSATVQP